MNRQNFIFFKKKFIFLVLIKKKNTHFFKNLENKKKNLFPKIF